MTPALLKSISFASLFREVFQSNSWVRPAPNFRNNSPSNHFDSFAYVNSDGHRDVERILARIPNRKRVILLGDSIVAGHGVTDLEDTVSRNLERVLADGTEVLNFGGIRSRIFAPRRQKVLG